MAMPRVTEPELMLDPEQALAYAQADFSASNEAFVERFDALTGGSWPAGALVLDLGCGPADIPVRLVLRHPAMEIHAVDGSVAMLELARQRLQLEPAVSGRIVLVYGTLPLSMLPATGYEAVISNSLLHHLHAPDTLWQAVKRFARPGAPVLVMDLFRPDSEAQIEAIIERYAAGEPDVLRTDFRNSLRAAFTPGEVSAQLAHAGLALDVARISDRHLLVSGRLPPDG